MQRFERRKNSRFADVLRELKEQETKRKVKDRRTLDMEDFLEKKMVKLFDAKFSQLKDELRHIYGRPPITPI